jgi:hypothetical protein
MHDLGLAHDDVGGAHLGSLIPRSIGGGIDQGALANVTSANATPVAHDLPELFASAWLI